MLIYMCRLMVASGMRARSRRLVACCAGAPTPMVKLVIAPQFKRTTQLQSQSLVDPLLLNYRVVSCIRVLSLQQVVCAVGVKARWAH